MSNASERRLGGGSEKTSPLEDSKPVSEAVSETPDGPSSPSGASDRCFPRIATCAQLPKVLAFSSLMLENKGSVARDHLSIERTWLSYMRTGLLIAGTGVAIVQCFALTTVVNPNDSLHAADTNYFNWSIMAQRFARPLGSTMVLVALILIIIGVRRFFKLQTAIMRGIFPAARVTVMLLSIVLAILVLVAIGSLLLTMPTV